MPGVNATFKRLYNSQGTVQQQHKLKCNPCILPLRRSPYCHPEIPALERILSPVDKFLNCNYLFACYCSDIVRRKYILSRELLVFRRPHAVRVTPALDKQVQKEAFCKTVMKVFFVIIQNERVFSKFKLSFPSSG